MRKIMIFAVLLLVVFSSRHVVWADWSLNFVVNDGAMYRITGESVAADSVERRLGEVSVYSDIEGSYRGNFSNIFPKGTEFYSIAGVDAGQAIAVKTGDKTFVKAKYEADYGGSSVWSGYKIWFGLALIVLLIMAAFAIFRKK